MDWWTHLSRSKALTTGAALALSQLYTHVSYTINTLQGGMEGCKMAFFYKTLSLLYRQSRDLTLAYKIRSLYPLTLMK